MEELQIILNNIDLTYQHCEQQASSTNFNFSDFKPQTMDPYFPLELLSKLLQEGAEALNKEQNIIYVNSEQAHNYKQQSYCKSGIANYLYPDYEEIKLKDYNLSQLALVGKTAEVKQVILKQLNQLEDILKQDRYLKFQQQSQDPSIEKIIVIADLHGSFADLYRIVTFYQLNDLKNSKTKVIFLGDYVDRGAFSVECLVICIILKLMFPNQIYLLRGNHEDEFNKAYFNVNRELELKYFSDCNDETKKQQLFQQLQTLFKSLPLCAIVNNQYFISHAAVPFVSLDMLQLFNRKQQIHNQQQNDIYKILWSDYEEAPGKAGRAKLNEEHVNIFLQKNKLKLIIRGHEFRRAGVEFLLNNKICNLFCIKNYGREGQRAVAEIYADQLFIRRIE